MIMQNHCSSNIIANGNEVVGDKHECKCLLQKKMEELAQWPEY